MTDQQPEAQQPSYTEQRPEGLNHPEAFARHTRGLGYNPGGADLQKDSTIAVAPPEWLIPASMKDQAKAWAELDARVDEAESEYVAARSAVRNAPAADKAARKAALAAGQSFAGSPEQDKAAARLREAEENMRIYNELIREASRELIKNLRANRTEVLTITAQRLAPAIDAARQAVAAAEAAIKTASQEVAEANTGLTLIESLDANTPDWNGAFLVDLPVPNMNPLRSTLQRLENNLGGIATPLKPKYLRVEVNGIVSDHIEPRSAKMLVENFGGREIPLYEGTSGLPEERKPNDGDSFRTGKQRRA